MLPPFLQVRPFLRRDELSPILAVFNSSAMFRLSRLVECAFFRFEFLGQIAFFDRALPCPLLPLFPFALLVVHADIWFSKRVLFLLMFPLRFEFSRLED